MEAGHDFDPDPITPDRALIGVWYGYPEDDDELAAFAIQRNDQESGPAGGISDLRTHLLTRKTSLEE